VKHLLLAAAAILAAPAFADTIAITGGTVAIGDGSQPIPNGTVIVRDGRVIAAGAGVAVPAGARTVDATGKWVTPGIVAGFTTLGIVDGYGMRETNDAQASDKTPFSAAIDVSTSINTESQLIASERTMGTTRAVVSAAPDHTMFGGQGAVIDLGADHDAVTKARAFQFVELGEGARDAAGSRPAAHVLLRAALAAARDLSQASGLDEGALITRADAVALQPVLAGRVPLLVHAERVADIKATLAIGHDFPGIKLILLGATEGWEIASEIAAARVPVIAAALADLPESFERLAATQSNVGRLLRAGVTVAISTVDASEGPYESYLRQYAGNLVALQKVPGASGLNWGEAFATISSKPAQVLGMDGEIGSLRAGRRADVVLWDGDPLEVMSAPIAVWIDGVAQPMTSRQLRLRDRYLTPSEGSLPKAYQH
jgi:imidazolonepropionase-like amidohydrolase